MKPDTDEETTRKIPRPAGQASELSPEELNDASGGFGFPRIPLYGPSIVSKRLLDLFRR
jgi:hypothetical protein